MFAQLWVCAHPGRCKCACLCSLACEHDLGSIRFLEMGEEVSRWPGVYQEAKPAGQGPRELPLSVGGQVCTTPDFFFFFFLLSWHFHKWTWVLVPARHRLYWLVQPFSFLLVTGKKGLQGARERENRVVIWHGFPWVLWNLTVCIWS